ncbi:hypothetical protein B9Z65_5675 [Elsinoe australis]|uniref:Uncharacterized protein n=1 Tax=Elsinoe australis TaxID=40998 RepID=A0A2P7YIR1_9PEZI|nr:hypothetical protein B9Z65_5675 [Elsinoe australis]
MSEQKSKADIIEERRSNLPLPEEPPVASDFNSSDASTVNVGSGGRSDKFSTGDASLRDPATGDSGVRVDPNSASGNVSSLSGVGREGKEGLGGLPSDALASGRNNDKVADTMNADKGYPHKSDPTTKQ